MVSTVLEIEPMSSCCQKVVIVTCDLAVVGKTTFALRLVQLPKATVVHYDRILAQLGISTLTWSQMIIDLAYLLALKEIQNALLRYDLVVLDVSLKEKHRRLRILTEIQKLVHACVLVVFLVPPPTMANVRLAKKKCLFRLTGDPIYSAYRLVTPA